MTASFPDPNEVQAACAEAGLDLASTQTFLAFAERVRTEPGLALHALAARDHLFEAVGDFDATIVRAESVFGGEAPLLRGLMLLESIRRVVEKHAARGVPEAVTHATLERHPNSTLRAYITEHGRPGADDWIWSWYRTVGSGNLYKLGRLEFVPEPWDYPFRIFEHRGTGEVVALLDAFQKFDDDGNNTGPTTWATSLVESKDAVIGHTISPRGYALRAQRRLERQEWQPLIGPAQTVLDMHIPGGSPLALEPVREALMQAGPFFDRFYPATPFVAFVCDSWVFSNQLEAMLPADSNIVRLQKEGYLFPDGVGQEPFLNFTFDASTIDLDRAPRDTTLRRAVVAHLRQGGVMRCGGFLFLRRDLPRFGSQPYAAS